MRLQPPDQWGWKPFRKIAAGSGDATLVQGKPSNLGMGNIYNGGGSAAFVKFYDSVTAPTAGAGTPVYVVGVPAAASVPIPGDGIGLGFANGIGFTIVAGAGDTYATGVTAGSVVVALGYSGG